MTERAEPLNAAMPDRVPLHPAGRYVHLIARLVYPDREEWRPAQTCRWTDTHVLAQGWDDAGAERLCWLIAGDVRRAVVVPREAEAPAVDDRDGSRRQRGLGVVAVTRSGQFATVDQQRVAVMTIGVPVRETPV